VPEQFLLTRAGIAQCANRVLWNQQNMNGRLRAHVMKSQAKIIFEHNFGRDFALYDFAKDRQVSPKFTFVYN
jgi:hypothetical protein